MVVNELLYCLWLVHVSFCTLFFLLKRNKLVIYPLFCYSLKMSLLAENVGKIISAHPEISAHLE